MCDKHYFTCLLCEKDQSRADIVNGRINVVGDNVNVLHSWPRDIAICNECIKLIKAILNKHRQKYNQPSG